MDPEISSPLSEGQLLFTWGLARVALEELTSGDKLKLGDKGLHVH